MLEPVRQLAATEGKRFAVISDETHLSQSNQTGAKLKLLLNAVDPAKRADLTDGGEIDTEDLLSAQMSAKAGGDQATGITWVAFTVTSKDKTRRSSAFCPIRPDTPAATNLSVTRHVHSMCQATKEGFIHYVLANCTSDKPRSRPRTRPAAAVVAKAATMSSTPM